MTEIKHIVFDVGHVLLHWDPELIYMNLIPDRSERQIFLKDICNNAWNAEQDTGRDWTEAEDMLVVQYPEKETLIRAYKKNWMDSVPHAFEDIAAVMTGLIETGYGRNNFVEFSPRHVR